MNMLVLRDGGRVLGLYASNSDENFFWVNSRVFNDPGAIWKEKWPNPGGDRCWLSPVCNIQLHRKSCNLKYRIPWRVDPGLCHVERWRDGAVRLCNVGKIFMRRGGKYDTFALERYLSWTENPLRHENWTGKLSYAGYSQRINLESLSCIENMLSPWSILQLPIGGEIVIPVYGGSSTVRHVLGMKNTDSLKFGDGKIQIKTDGKEDFLLSIPPQMSTGRIGYLRQDGREWTLVVRNFNVNPSDEYLNCFSRMSKKPGYAVQSRIVSEGDLSHVELHHHVPATSSQVIHDTSQTWCFRGNEESILRAAACLTGYEPFPSCGRLRKAVANEDR